MPDHRPASAVLVLLAGLAAPAASQSTTPAPAPVSADQFRTLRWIEGDWRGTGAGGLVFFERYRFLNDSTIEQTTYADSTFSKPQERSALALRAGAVTKGDPVKWVVTRVDTAGWQFSRVRDAASRFVWRPLDAHRWIAILTPASGPVVRYELRRFTRGQ